MPINLTTWMKWISSLKNTNYQNRLKKKETSGRILMHIKTVAKSLIHQRT